MRSLIRFTGESQCKLRSGPRFGEERTAVTFSVSFVDGPCEIPKKGVQTLHSG